MRKRFRAGGMTEQDIAMSNVDMAQNLINSVQHHASEISELVTEDTKVPAWVVSLLDRAEVDLSDVAHYIDGELKKFGKGGETAEEVVRGNAYMTLSQIKAVKHHAEELDKLVKKNTPIEAWVLARLERAATYLSDVTHYLDGVSEEYEDKYEGYMKKGGKLPVVRTQFEEEEFEYADGGEIELPISKIIDEEIRVYPETIKKLLNFIGEGIDTLDVESYMPKMSYTYLNEIRINFYEDSWGGISKEDWNKAGEILDKYVGKNGFDSYEINPSYNRLQLDFSYNNYPMGDYYEDEDLEDEDLDDYAQGGELSDAEFVEEAANFLNYNEYAQVIKDENGDWLVSYLDEDDDYIDVKYDSQGIVNLALDRGFMPHDEDEEVDDDYAKGGAVAKEYTLYPMIPYGAKGFMSPDFKNTQRVKGTYEEAVEKAKEMVDSNPNIIRVEIKRELKTKSVVEGIVNGQMKDYKFGGDVGRFYKASDGQTYRFIGDQTDSTGIFSIDGKYVTKDYSDFDYVEPRSRFMGIFEDGGILEDMSIREKGKVFSFLDKYNMSDEVRDWWDDFGYTKEESEEIQKGWAKSRGYMADGGMMEHAKNTIAKFQVLSPDGITIEFDKPYYPSKKKAFEAFDKWKKRYEAQGYYSSNEYGRIPLEDLEDYISVRQMAKGGKVKRKRWIQDAINPEHKGMLRATAKRKHLIEGDEKLSLSDLHKLEKMGGKTAQRAHLAETLRKFK